MSKDETILWTYSLGITGRSGATFPALPSEPGCFYRLTLAASDGCGHVLDFNGLAAIQQGYAPTAVTFSTPGNIGFSGGAVLVVELESVPQFVLTSFVIWTAGTGAGLISPGSVIIQKIRRGCD